MPRVPRTDFVKVALPVATGLSVEPLNTPATSDAIDIADSTGLGVEVDLIRGGGLTSLAIEVEVSLDDGSNWAPLQEFNGPSPGIGLDPLVLTRTTSASERFAISLGGNDGITDLRPFDLVRLKFTGAAATVDDTITVTATKVRGD